MYSEGVQWIVYLLHYRPHRGIHYQRVGVRRPGQFFQPDALPFLRVEEVLHFPTLQVDCSGKLFCWFGCRWCSLDGYCSEARRTCWLGGVSSISQSSLIISSSAVSVSSVFIFFRGGL